jgi:hypothetical protein
MASPIQQSGSTDVKKVMISSTALDLPEHRDLVKDACLRQGMFPIMMEYLPAADTDAIEESLRIVNEADIYLGIFAYRYGLSPKVIPSLLLKWSITVLLNVAFPV